MRVGEELAMKNGFAFEARGIADIDDLGVAVSSDCGCAYPFAP